MLRNPALARQVSTLDRPRQFLNFITATVAARSAFPSNEGTAVMPTDQAIYLAGIIILFIILAGTLFYAERRTHNLPKR